MKFNDLVEVKYDGCILPGYYLDKENVELWSTRKCHLNRFTNNSKENVCYGGDLRKVKGTKHKKKYTIFGMRLLHSDLLLQEKYRNLYDNTLRVQMHRLMMETFSPFETNLPKDLVNEWPKLSDVVKDYLRNGMTIDHIDPDHTKPTYNHISNLQWMTISDNSRKGDRCIKLNPLEELLWN